LIIYDTCSPPVTGFTHENEELDIYFQNASQNANEYYWDFGDGYYSDLEDPWHHYQEEGLYEVCLTTWNECWSDVFCEWIEVCEYPEAAFTFTIEDLTAFFEDQSEKAESWYWDFGDGYYSDLPDPVHIYDTQENYQVCLITWNECGSDTICQMLYLNAVSVPEYREGFFNIYPNPASKKVFVKALFDGQSVIGLHDLSGKEIIKQDIFFVKDEPVEIDLGNIDPGIYIVRMDSGENHSFEKLIVIP
jgi:PKD repeat protein